MASNLEKDASGSNRFSALTVDDSSATNDDGDAALVHKNMSTANRSASTILNAHENNEALDADGDDTVSPAEQMEFIVTSEWANSQATFELQCDHNRSRGLHLSMKHFTKPTKSKAKKLEIFRAIINGKCLYESSNAEFAVARDNAYTGAVKELFQRSGTIIVREGCKYRSTLIKEDERNERAFKKVREHPDCGALCDTLRKLDITVNENYDSLRPTFMENRKTTNAKQLVHITYATISLIDGERFNPNNILHMQQIKIPYPYPPGMPVPEDKWQCGVQINGMELVSECGQTSMQAEAFATRAAMNLLANYAGCFKLGTKYTRALDKVNLEPFGYKEENFPSLAGGKMPNNLPRTLAITQRNNGMPTADVAVPSWTTSLRPVRPPHMPFPNNYSYNNNNTLIPSAFQQRCIRSQVPFLTNTHRQHPVMPHAVMNNSFFNNTAVAVSDDGVDDVDAIYGRPSPMSLSSTRAPSTAGSNGNLTLFNSDAVSAGSFLPTYSQRQHSLFPSTSNNNTNGMASSLFNAAPGAPPNNRNNYYNTNSGYNFNDSGTYSSFHGDDDNVDGAEGGLVSRRSNPILNSMYAVGGQINSTSGLALHATKAAFSPAFPSPALASEITPTATAKTSLMSPWPPTPTSTTCTETSKNIDTSSTTVIELLLPKDVLDTLRGTNNMLIDSCTRAQSVQYQIITETSDNNLQSLRLSGAAENLQRVKRILSSRIIQHCGRTLQQIVEEVAKTRQIAAEATNDYRMRNTTNATNSSSSADIACSSPMSSALAGVKKHDADLLNGTAAKKDLNIDDAARNSNVKQPSPATSTLPTTLSAGFFDNNNGMQLQSLVEQRLRLLEDENKALKTAINIFKDRDSEAEEFKVKYENVVREKDSLEQEKHEIRDNFLVVQRNTERLEQESRNTQIQIENFKFLEQNLYDSLANEAKLREDCEFEISKLRSRLSKLTSAECIVCLDELRNTLFEPCRHAVMCWRCCSNSKDQKCPICRQTIQSTTAFILS